MNILLSAVPGGGKSYATGLMNVMLDFETCKAQEGFGMACPVTGSFHTAQISWSEPWKPLPHLTEKMQYKDDLSFKIKDLATDDIDYVWKCIEWFKRGPAFQKDTICTGHTAHTELIDTLYECEERHIELPEFKCLAIGVDSMVEAHAVAVANLFKQDRRPYARHIQNAEYAVEYKKKYGSWPTSWGEALMLTAYNNYKNFGPIKATEIGNTEITWINYWTLLDKPIETITEFLGMTPTQEQLDMMQQMVNSYNDTQDLHIELMMSMPWQEELDAILEGGFDKTDFNDVDSLAIKFESLYEDKV